MQTFQKKIKVEQEDLDELDHVNNVRYVQWVQDVAKEHWLAASDAVTRNEVVWVVLKHTISYKHAAKLGDVIIAKTYIKDTKAATSIRMVEMFDQKTDKLIISSETEWVLLNGKTLKPMRVSEKIKDAFKSGTPSST